MFDVFFEVTTFIPHKSQRASPLSSFVKCVHMILLFLLTGRIVCVVERDMSRDFVERVVRQLLVVLVAEVVVLLVGGLALKVLVEGLVLKVLVEGDREKHLEAINY